MPIEINFIQSVDCTPDYKVRDSHGVLQRYHVTEEDLLQLCGGIPCRNILFANIEIVSITENTLTVAMNTDLY